MLRFGECGEENGGQERSTRLEDCEAASLPTETKKKKTAGNQHTHTKSQELIVICVESPNRFVYTHISVIISNSSMSLQVFLCFLASFGNYFPAVREAVVCKFEQQWSERRTGRCKRQNERRYKREKGSDVSMWRM